MKDNILKQQLLTIADYMSESKREDVLRGELLNKIRVHQFNERSESIVWKTIAEGIFMLFSPWSNVPALRTVTYFFMGILVSLGMALGAYTAGPGDSLYPVKLGVERIPLAMPLVSENTKFDAELKNAAKRQNEIIEIIASEESVEDKSKKIEEAGKELTRTIASSEKRVQKMSKRPYSAAGAGTAASLKVSVAKIKQTLDNAIQTESTGTAKDSKELAKALEKIYAAASVVELSSLEVMVEAVAGDEPKLVEAPSDAAQENADSKEDGRDAAPVRDSSGTQEIEERGGKQGAEPKPSAEQNSTDEKKEGDGAVEEKGVDENQVEEELNIAIVSLRARLDQLLDKQQNNAEETESVAVEAPEKESDAKTTTEATFEVAEVLRLQARQEKVKETKETIESAESALQKGDLKGALEFIKRGEELLAAVE